MKFTKIATAGFMITAFTAALCTSPAAQAQQGDMTFFVTSVGMGKGADLGGLQGADAHCAALAKAVGARHGNWHAYLSTTPPAGAVGINARDRIGKGPWKNAKGVVIAKSVDDLHSANNNLNKQTALSENGEVISGRGDPVNHHDILTGSDSDGYSSTASGDTTCHNWTSSSDGSAIVGHADRKGLNDGHQMTAWNSSHATPGCSPDALKKVGGAGLLYCFAADE
jgi:hypothetical protein